MALSRGERRVLDQMVRTQTEDPELVALSSAPRGSIAANRVPANRVPANRVPANRVPANRISAYRGVSALGPVTGTFVVLAP